jgi:hypothetical protein
MGPEGFFPSRVLYPPTPGLNPKRTAKLSGAATASCHGVLSTGRSHALNLRLRQAAATAWHNGATSICLRPPPLR